VETYLLRSVLEPRGRARAREIPEERQREEFFEAAAKALFGKISATEPRERSSVKRGELFTRD
jgi:hypothetical protein